MEGSGDINGDGNCNAYLADPRGNRILHLAKEARMIGLLALLGIILIVLAIVHVVPFVLGLILGIVLVVIGGGVYYNGRGGPL